MLTIFCDNGETLLCPGPGPASGQQNSQRVGMKATGQSLFGLVSYRMLGAGSIVIHGAKDGLSNGYVRQFNV